MFVLLSASLSSLPIKENIERHKRLRADLAAEDYESLTCSGVYTGQDGVTVKELSLLVPIPIRGTWLDPLRIAKRYGQESILLDNGGLGSLVYCADNRVVNRGERRPGVADNYTSTVLGDFHYA